MEFLRHSIILPIHERKSAETICISKIEQHDGTVIPIDESVFPLQIRRAASDISFGKDRSVAKYHDLPIDFLCRIYPFAVYVYWRHQSMCSA